MDIQFTSNEFMQLLADALGGKVEDTESEFIFVPKHSSALFYITKSDLESLRQRFSMKSISDNTMLYDSKTCEVAVKQVSRPVGSLQWRNRELTDEKNGITYSIEKPSEEYLMYLLVSLGEPNKRIILRDMIFLYPEMSMRKDFLDKENRIALLDYLKEQARLTTLRISTSKLGVQLHDFENWINSFTFHLSYNFDRAIIPARSFEEFRRVHRLKNPTHRRGIKEIDAPRLSYMSDLVHHYQMGFASGNSALAFLSYYHVIEHFFENIFYDNLIPKIRSKITHPSFSYKEDKDIKNLIQSVGKDLKLNQDSLFVNELEALKLTLQKYLDIPHLLSDLSRTDLLNYYRENTVSFSGGDKVDLESNDKPQILNRLADRIYKTRNAIVHSKETGKARYKPFEHDALLAQEIPLIRFIAEQIITKTADPL